MTSSVTAEYSKSAAAAAEIEKLKAQLAEANSRASVVENLQAQLEQLKAQVAQMGQGAAKAVSHCSAADIKAETVALQEVLKDKRVKVRIANGEGKEGREAVPVLVNGQMIYIPRNQEAVIPKCAYEALLHAQITTWDTDPNGRTTKSAEVPRFNVVYLGEADADAK